ncbi:alpha/beta-hydrolase [Karstenula rhodostoma CBS 690.94]|uniref:Alpha/beta-hydrolase n=1 Tax=Karstenula rhodostoma CBS 690.94 TaxID=1392251 RepID=A0A9P4PCR9_9PLEO|nr:alpha/beta-hydrolase [Karstenula rhodostoma CBS 690.94]
MATATRVRDRVGHAQDKTKSKTKAAMDFAHQAEKLAYLAPDQENDATGSTQAVEAKFITAQDPVIVTADGGRLPAVPVDEAKKLNELRDEIDDRDPSESAPVRGEAREAKDGTIHGARPPPEASPPQAGEEGRTDAPLQSQTPPSRTNPLFPPLPMYGPPSMLRKIQVWCFRCASAVLSLCFLLVIILGALFTSIPDVAKRQWMRLTFQDPDKSRPFYHEEDKRKKARQITEKAWGNRSHSQTEADAHGADEFVPLEGGPDKIPCDVRYYARRVGLDCEIFDVQTEDGFIIELWHIYNPREYKRSDPSQRTPNSPDVFKNATSTDGVSGSQYEPGDKKYPVIMIHGLLQSAGAYCTNDDDSLAFFLAKSGYDVWLGNNRCGFRPRHNMLSYSDPRMWAWNIRQMGVMDLPALISRVLAETGFPKLGLIAHSQGTTQTLVALAKEQRPEIGEKISVFCALAPAAYAGPLIGKMYFKFMRVISPGMFRAIFGIHAFIPFMMTMHSLLPPRFYGAMGYRVFSFLFNWTDDRWERDLRDRMFQFAPVYVSAESMRWWLGRECFAKQKCILATREEKIIEDREDAQEDKQRERSDESSDDEDDELGAGAGAVDLRNHDNNRAKYAWYGPRTPPFAFWVCGNDALVDGRRLLRRFERGREPHVDLVHSKVIEGYEHLDVIWAMDAIEKVGKEVREVIWKTAGEKVRKVCRTPRGCAGIKEEEYYKKGGEQETEPRRMDTTAGEWSAKGREQVSGGGGEGDRNLEEEIRVGDKRM